MHTYIMQRIVLDSMHGLFISLLFYCRGQNKSLGITSTMLCGKFHKGTSKTEKNRSSCTGASCFDLVVPLCNLQPSKAEVVACDLIVQTVYLQVYLLSAMNNLVNGLVCLNAMY